ncbi:MAG: type II toxin-antitoxin system VapC family toxin [Myxococcales bacterium]|nr:type II toxin-antitoxin system VapC family toxin [Myxococcales bacterium]
MKRLLDTNAYVALKREHQGVTELVRDSTELVFSMVVIGELLFGFRNGARFEKNAKELNELLADVRVSVLDVTRTTADRFGRIASELREAGTPIPSNDIWIAAHVFESGAELISFDQHFEAVRGLVWTRLQ